MENRERDQVSRGTGPTDAGKINREVASRRGQEEHLQNVEFGQNIGEAENLEPNTRRGPAAGSSGTGQPASTGQGKGQNEGRSGSSEGRH